MSSGDNIRRCPHSLLWDLYDRTQPVPDVPFVYGLPRTGCDCVNVIINKMTVRIDADVASGLEIKKAAIAQGVDIKLDDKLAEILKDGHQVSIGDAENIHLQSGDKFIATAH